MPANNEIIPQSVREAVAAALEAAFKAGRSPEDVSVWHTAADAAMDVIALASPVPLGPTPNTDSVPAGMVLVPREATDEMESAGNRAMQEQETWLGRSPGAVWSAMIAAATTGSSDSYTPAGEEA